MPMTGKRTGAAEHRLRLLCLAPEAHNSRFRSYYPDN